MESSPSDFHDFTAKYKAQVEASAKQHPAKKGGKESRSKSKGKSKSTTAPISMDELQNLYTMEVMKRVAQENGGLNDRLRRQTALPFCEWMEGLVSSQHLVAQFYLKDILYRMVQKCEAGLGPALPSHVVPRIIWSQKGKPVSPSSSLSPKFTHLV